MMPRSIQACSLALLGWLFSNGAVQAQNTVMTVYQSDGSAVPFPLFNVDSVVYKVYNFSTPGAGVTDAEGNTYSSMVFGNGQEWMTRNLETRLYSNGDTIEQDRLWPNSQEVIQGAETDGVDDFVDTAYVKDFGRLYNAYAIMDPRNVCPTGWRVPSDTDWVVLASYLQGDTTPLTEQLTYGWQWPGIGGLLKEPGFMPHTGRWNWPNQDATNATGFSAVGSAADYGSGNAIYSLGHFAYYWSTTLDLYWQSFGMVGNRLFLIQNDSPVTMLSPEEYTTKVAVRCIRDE